MPVEPQFSFRSKSQEYDSSKRAEAFYQDHGVQIVEEEEKKGEIEEEQKEYPL